MFVKSMHEVLLFPFLPIRKIQPLRDRNFAVAKALIQGNVSIWIV